MLESASFVQVKDHIDLTKDEEELFNCLLQVVNHLNHQTQLRVAGGWVRDKLLGLGCNDIDIVLDNMSGHEFCEKVNEYLSGSGEEILAYGVIRCNPDQSKHLETARMHYSNNVWIDFVNLREEDYCNNSRIPKMRYGTAEKDAYRRDLTINSLFYNINTSSVEDFTGRGIADLKSGKIVTPLPPKQTFLDDPLRVLRAIRFGARFGFMLDEDLKKAAVDEDVRAAIANKISRERIGHEIDLMMSDKQPVQAMTYIVDLKLFWTVFSLPSDFEPSIPEGCDRETVYRGNKVKKIPVVDYIFRNSLKLKARDAETVISLHTATKKFVTLIPLLVSKEDIQVLEVNRKRNTIEVPIAPELTVLTGILLREIKDFWRVSLLLSMLLHPIDTVSYTSFSNEYVDLDKRSGLFKTMENAVRTLGLENIWEMTPLVNGKDIMDKLEIKSGRVVGELQQKLIEWQLAHPSGSVGECIEHLKAIKNMVLIKNHENNSLPSS